MKLPPQLLRSLQGIPGFDERTFVQVHESGEQVTSIRINPAKPLPTPDSRLPALSPVPWSSFGYYLAERPSFTFDPRFHAGAYYVQEASGMFLEQALKQTVDLSRSVKVLDLCAAPGGKSTHIQSLLSRESILVSNDVIRSRAAVLEENMTKWGAPNVVVTNNDPAHLARLPHYFDVLVIDAPCSGSGLFRRDPDAIGEWSENNVQLCSQRQQRIIADVWPALKPGGILIYSTCSYSKEEDEDILDWLVGEFRAGTVKLAVEEDWHIVETRSEKNNAIAYRFYPDKIKGEGLFMAVVQKQEEEEVAAVKSKKVNVERISKAEEAMVKEWLNDEEALFFFRHQDSIIALPAALQADLLQLQPVLYIRKAGVRAGKIAAKSFIPDHQLALSSLISNKPVSIALNHEQAIQYLRREEVVISSGELGWAAVSFEGYYLGWVKRLSNRVNNYYPKEWRILKPF